MLGWKQGDGFLAEQECRDIVLISFLTSGFAEFICLWLLVLPNSNKLINRGLIMFFIKFWLQYGYTAAELQTFIDNTVIIGCN